MIFVVKIHKNTIKLCSNQQILFFFIKRLHFMKKYVKIILILRDQTRFMED